MTMEIQVRQGMSESKWLAALVTQNIFQGNGETPTTPLYIGAHHLNTAPQLKRVRMAIVPEYNGADLTAFSKCGTSDHALP